MNKFEKACILAVLQDTIDRLIILGKGQYQSAEIVAKMPVKERFNSRVHEMNFDEKANPFVIPTETLQELKIQKHLNEAITIFAKTIREILNNETSWEFMKRTIQEHKQQLDDEAKLLRDYEETKNELQEIKKLYKSKMSSFEIRLHAANEKISELKQELENVQKLNAIEFSLITRWEQTRFDQAKIIRKKSEKEIASKIQLYEFKLEKEKRNIDDVENFIEAVIKNYNEQILFWEQKYQTEMKELSEKTATITKNILQLKKKYEKYCDIFKNQQDFIILYRERKAEEQKQLEFQQKRIDSAVKIQAWWRGVMVRRCLGPFKKKKKGKKGKKK